ncbi:hypothetical protein AB0I28_05300 [Phytomonospora sp. NPDC050363]|uniref:hypothetical protein n=1 Tax=Phytomonospora sp. NPDC050363 TaxID=3155642 RepID=UPI0033D1DA29
MTLSLAVRGRVGWLDAAGHVVAQLVGGLLGGLLLWGAAGDDVKGEVLGVSSAIGTDQLVTTLVGLMIGAFLLVSATSHWRIARGARGARGGDGDPGPGRRADRRGDAGHRRRRWRPPHPALGTKGGAPAGSLSVAGALERMFHVKHRGRRPGGGAA